MNASGINSPKTQPKYTYESNFLRHGHLQRIQNRHWKCDDDRINDYIKRPPHNVLDVVVATMA